MPHFHCSYAHSCIAIVFGALMREKADGKTEGSNTLIQSVVSKKGERMTNSLPSKSRVMPFIYVTVSFVVCISIE
jgi:hypothetical protein